MRRRRGHPGMVTGVVIGAIVTIIAIGMVATGAMITATAIEPVVV